MQFTRWLRKEAWHLKEADARRKDLTYSRGINMSCDFFILSKHASREKLIRKNDRTDDAKQKLRFRFFNQLKKV